MARIDDGDVGAGHTGNFVELLANFCFESRSCRGLVKDFLTRDFNSSTVMLIQRISTGDTGDSRQRTYLKGAVTKEDGLCSHNGLERAKEREEP